MDLLLNIMYVLYTVFSTYLGAQIFFVQRERWRIDFLCILGKGFILFGYSGLLIFREKKAKFRGIFRGKFAEKSADFTGFSREKSQNSPENRLISRDFSGKKSNFEGFSGANS